MRHSMRREMKIIAIFTPEMCRHHSIAKQLVSSRYFCHSYIIIFLTPDR